MRVNYFRTEVATLGPGLRAVIWFQGCSLNCPGCVSTDTWPANEGEEHSIGHLVETLLVNPQLTGVTISGGEPLQQPDHLLALLEAIRAHNEQLDILLYTGFDQAEVERDAPWLFDAVDGAVIGRFEVGKMGDDHWRGSTNQRLVVCSQLGKDRLTPWVNSEGRGLQVGLADLKLWIVGIPKKRELQRLQKQLSAEGIEVSEQAWRP